MNKFRVRIKSDGAFWRLELEYGGYPAVWVTNPVVQGRWYVRKGIPETGRRIDAHVRNLLDNARVRQYGKL